MGAESSKKAEVAAAGESSKSTTGAGEFPPEMMNGVFAKFGQKPPTAITEKKEGEQTADEKAAATGEGEAGAGEGGEGAAAAGEGEAGAGQGGEKAAATGEGEAGAGEGGEGAAAAGEGEAGAGQGGEKAAEGEDPQAKQLSEETARLLKVKLKDLPEDVRGTVQSFMDQRIAAITGKAKSENDRLGTRVTELTGEVEALRKDGPVPVVIPGVHPALLAESPQQIDQELDRIEKFEDWANQYREGFNLPDSEGHDPAQQSFTAEQIRARLREVQREKDRVLPLARTKLADRTKADEGLRAILPAQFDPKAPEYGQARKLLEAQPHLRTRADQNIIIAQQILGAKALQQLQERAAGKKPGNSSPNAGKQPAAGAKPALKKAPRAPGDGSPAHGSPLDRPDQRPAAESAVKTFTQTRSRADLTKAVGALVFR